MTLPFIGNILDNSVPTPLVGNFEGIFLTLKALSGLRSV